MTKPPLGRLEKVTLRAYWEREDTEFTPWLGQPGNIALLGDALGVTLEVQQQEASVGPFRADLLCRNADDGSLVLIENQLEATDHTHLGQILTYAAGLDVVTVVWIAQQFTEEHRAALDWLNRITHEGFHFFGVEIELWKIGESQMAPRLNIVAKPNEWTKSVQAHRQAADAERLQMYSILWTDLLDYLAHHHPTLELPNPSGVTWLRFKMHDTHCMVSYAPAPHVLSFYLLFRGDHPVAWQRAVAADSKAIAKDIGEQLDWKPGENNGPGYAILKLFDFDHRQKDAHPAIFARLGNLLEQLDQALAPRHAAFLASLEGT